MTLYTSELAYYLTLRGKSYFQPTPPIQLLPKNLELPEVIWEILTVCYNKLQRDIFKYYYNNTLLYRNGIQRSAYQSDQLCGITAREDIIYSMKNCSKHHHAFAHIKKLGAVPGGSVG